MMVTEPPNPPDALRVFIDGTGLWPTVVDFDRYPVSAPRPKLSFEQWNRLDVLHYSLRASHILFGDATDAELERVLDMSLAFLDLANNMLFDPAYSQDPPQPIWASEAFDCVANALRSDYPQIDELSLRIVWEPRLHVRVLPTEAVIEISLVTRELLRTLNLAIWDHLWTPEGAHLSVHAATLHNDWDVFLPLLLPLYYGRGWSQNPFVRANSETAARFAIDAAWIQIILMIAHEVAHFLLDDGEVRSEAKEASADAFAASTLARMPLFIDDTERVWTAVRWLEGILRFDRVLAWRLSGDERDPPVKGSRHFSDVYTLCRTRPREAMGVITGALGVRLLVEIEEGLSGRTVEQVRRRASQWLSASEASSPRVSSVRRPIEDKDGIEL